MSVHVPPLPTFTEGRKSFMLYEPLVPTLSVVLVLSNVPGSKDKPKSDSKVHWLRSDVISMSMAVVGHFVGSLAKVTPARDTSAMRVFFIVMNKIGVKEYRATFRRGTQFLAQWNAEMPTEKLLRVIYRVADANASLKGVKD